MEGQSVHQSKGKQEEEREEEELDESEGEEGKSGRSRHQHQLMLCIHPPKLGVSTLDRDFLQ
jgi:hypothetical protein